MKLFLLNVALAVIWAILEGEINLANLIFGFILGYAILLLSRRAFGSSRYIGAANQLIRLALFFLWEMLVANLILAYDVLTPHMTLMKPRIIAVPLDLTSNIQITALSNLLSLTPGSLSLDVSSDRRVLYVHVLYAKNAKSATRALKEGIERRLRELTELTSKD